MKTASEIAGAAEKRAVERRGNRRADVADEAVRLRTEERLSWREIAARLDYRSDAAALRAAQRAGFTASEVTGHCRVCGIAIPRIGIRGRLPEYCDLHAAERIKERAEERQAALTASLPELRCVDCSRPLERGPGRLPDRCSDCARFRRRTRERLRDRRRKAAKIARAKAVGYTTAHWRRIRKEGLAAADGCVDCGAVDDLTVHLANPALGGDHRKATVDDVEVLCRRCHGALSAQPA